MHKYTLRFFFLLLCFVICGHSNGAASPNHLGTVERFVNAYNQHDIEKMLEQMTKDVKWFYKIDNQLVIETANKHALQKAMKSHFKQRPNARSEITDNLVLGNTVVAIEQAFSNDGKRSQCAISIYEMKQTLIASVTYHNATACH